MPTERVSTKYCPSCGREYAGGEVCGDDGAVLVFKPSETDPLIGQVLDDTFTVEERIGGGGMSAVYRGTQKPIGRSVAIKVLLPELQPDPIFVKRFFREAKILGEVTHPNILSMIDCGNTADGLIYIVTEYLGGTTLDKVVTPGEGMRFDEVVAVMEQVCAGIAEAHAHNVAHRDLKPSNVFVLATDGPKPQVKILDFGIAKPLNEHATQLTKTGAFVGTPGYMAPEQLERDEVIDARADIYALGALLYLISAGKPAYTGRSSESIIAKQLRDEPEPVDFMAIGKPVELNAVIHKAMHKDREQRYQTPLDLAEAVKHCADDAWDGSARPAIGERDQTLEQAAYDAPTREGDKPSKDPDATEAVEVISPATTEETKPAPSRVPSFVVASAILGLAVAGIVGVSSLLPQTSTVEELPAAPSPTPASLRGVTKTHIRFGMSAAFTGPTAELGVGVRTGVLTRFKEQNERGGLHGRQLELIALDDGYEPDRAVKNTLELVGQRNVFALIGNVGTPTAQKTVPIAVNNQLPFFGPITGADILRTVPPSPWVYHYRASYAEETATMVDHFTTQMKIPAAKIAVFAQDDAFGDSGFRGVATTLAAHGVNGEDVIRVGYGRNTVEVEDAVDYIAQHRREVRAIVTVATHRPSARFIKGLRDRKVMVPIGNVSFVNGRALADELKRFGDEYMRGVLVSQVVPAIDAGLLGVERYRQSLRTHFPDEPPSAASLEGYITASVMIEALARLEGELTAGELLGALSTLDGIDLGIGAPIGFSDASQQASHRVWLTELRTDGSYTTLSGAAESN